MINKDYLGDFRKLMKGNLYFDNKTNDKKHIFNKLSSNSNFGYYPHPYGYFFRRPKWDCNDLGFRCKYDLHTLRKKRNKYFLIVILGGAAGQNPQINDEKLYSNQLEKILNKNIILKSKKKFMILNLCVQGHTILSQMISYILFSQNLRPDLVISFSGITDINRSFHNDKILLSEYNINYEPIFEGWAKQIHQKDIDLRLNNTNKKIANLNSIIIKTFIIRLNQLKNLVEYTNSNFLLVLHPIIQSKKKISYKEKQILLEEHQKKPFSKKKPFINESVKVYNLLSSRLENMPSLRYLNLHRKFNQLSNETHFSTLDKTNIKGEKYIVQHMYKKIKSYKKLFKII